MKNSTKNIHTQIANNALYYIYKYIDSDINIDTLSKELGVSRFHLQRLFKEQIGTNIYETIKSIRLHKASNLLITNQGSTISEVAKLCGYSSQSSFIRVFKERFKMTPTTWRKGGYKKYSNSIIKSSKSASKSIANFNNLEAQIVKQPDIRVYYIRHKGYSSRIKDIWQRLRAWQISNNIESYKEIAIYHDNPVITPLAECRYIASVAADKELNNTQLPSFIIPGGLYVKFKAKGKYGDILKLLEWIYHHWLPNSGYEATTLPSYSMFKKNHFLSSDNTFDLEFYLPVVLR